MKDRNLSLAALSVSLVLVSGGNAVTQELEDILPFSVDETVPTVEEVERESSFVREALEVDGCQEALSSLSSVANDALLLSELIQQGLRPFILTDQLTQEILLRDASRREEVYGAERTSKSLRRLAHEFMLLEAECLLAEGQTREAVETLYRALQTIDVAEERPIWREVRHLLWETIGYEYTQ